MMHACILNFLHGHSEWRKPIKEYQKMASLKAREQIRKAQIYSNKFIRILGGLPYPQMKCKNTKWYHRLHFPTIKRGSPRKEKGSKTTKNAILYTVSHNGEELTARVLMDVQTVFRNLHAFAVITLRGEFGGFTKLTSGARSWLSLVSPPKTILWACRLSSGTSSRKLASVEFHRYCDRCWSRRIAHTLGAETAHTLGAEIDFDSGIPKLSFDVTHEKASHDSIEVSQASDTQAGRCLWRFVLHKEGNESCSLHKEGTSPARLSRVRSRSR